MTAESDVEPVPPSIGAEIKIERMDDGQYRVAVYLEGQFYTGTIGFQTFDEAKAAADDFEEMVCSLPGVKKADLQ